MARTHHPIRLRRVYEPPASAAEEGTRVLVDRVWPRGIRKESLAHDLWLRDLGPSTTLRKWFGHQPERWDEFRRRYREELVQDPQRGLLDQLEELARRGPLTLLYSARDERHNQAVVIREGLEDRLRGDA
ncbi:MAG: DUF488 family protein [Candidatus Dormibacteraeota bacterium]|nr:DUF488 family protein [Candidatus Dormibacteraeota bacterium]